MRPGKPRRPGREETAMAEQETPTAIPPFRAQAPRPLALHLALANMTWTNSRAGLTNFRNSSMPWRAEVSREAEALRADLGDLPEEDFAAAVDRAHARRNVDLIAAITAYRRHPYRRDVEDPAPVWQRGTTLLRDFGPLRKPPGPKKRKPAKPMHTIFAVPSLVNRAYILDLNAEASLLRYLARKGHHPLLLDWQAPGAGEAGFSVSDYITDRLEPALEVAADMAGGPVVVLGYCMGGLLTLALATRRPDLVKGLVLLATPWDFHSADLAHARAAPAVFEAQLPAYETLGQMPVDALQGMFAALDPMLAVRKFLRFGTLDPASPQAAGFVALEDWVNDGVALTAPVARECLIDWYRDNLPAQGKWTVAGTPVVPEEFDRPSLLFVPSNDRIVPPGSAAALADALPDATLEQPPAGHIGMVTGSRARATVWKPLTKWLGRLPE